jgi:hypothetical protein
MPSCWYYSPLSIVKSSYVAHLFLALNSSLNFVIYIARCAGLPSILPQYK